MLIAITIAPIYGWAQSGTLAHAVARWEKTFKQLSETGAAWIKHGQAWESFQPKLDAITRQCEPERVPELKRKKIAGKVIGDRFLKQLSAASTLPTFTQEEKADPCALAAKLEVLKQASSGLKEAYRGARHSGFETLLANGKAELEDGYSKYDQFGDLSRWIAKEFTCDGTDPGPTTNTARKRLGVFQRDTSRFVEGINQLRIQTDKLVALLEKQKVICPATADAKPAPESDGAQRPATAAR